MNRTVNLEDIFPIISEQLENGGQASFVIHGTSMLPMLKDGIDSVRLTEIKGDIKKYDVIFYRRDDGNFILHRVIKVLENGFICRGDCHAETEFVRSDSVIAIMNGFTRKGKWVSTDAFCYKLYARIRVNSLFIRKVLRRSWKGNKK